MALQTITSEELHCYFTTRKSTEGILKGIRSALFSETRFPQLEKSLSKYRARYFKDLKSYYVEFLSRFRQANYCLHDNEQLTDRDRLTYFVKGLTQEQRQLFIDKEYDDLATFVEYIDKRSCLQHKFQTFDEAEQRRSNQFHSKKSSVPEAPAKFCELHGWKKHSTAQCKVLNEQTRTQSTTPSENKNNRSLFIDASRDPSIGELKFDGHLHDRPITIILDSGSN